MARITIEDCEKVESNRFKMIDKAARRARRLKAGFDVPRVPHDNDKATVIALRELAEGLLSSEHEAAQAAALSAQQDALSDEGEQTDS
jgi:DNA-directed RNA polymerase subunit omega